MKLRHLCTVVVLFFTTSVSCKKKSIVSGTFNLNGVETREAFARKSNALTQSRLMLAGMHKAWKHDYLGENGILARSNQINTQVFTWSEQWRTFDRFTSKAEKQSFDQVIPELTEFLNSQNSAAAQISYETNTNIQLIHMAKSRLMNSKVIDYQIAGYDQSYRQMIRTRDELVSVLDNLKEKHRANDEAIRLSHSYLVSYAKTKVLAAITMRAASDLSNEVKIAKSLFEVEADFGAAIAEIIIDYNNFNNSVQNFGVFSLDAIYRKVQPKCDAIMRDITARDVIEEIKDHYQALLETRCGYMHEMHRKRFKENPNVAQTIAKHHKLNITKASDKCNQNLKGINCGLFKNMSLITEQDILEAESALLADIEQSWKLVETNE